MFRDQAQRAEACLTLLTLLGLERFWDERPTNEAFEVLDAKALSSGELVFLRAALDIWNPGSGHADLGDILNHLDATCSQALWSLVLAIHNGPETIDAWIEDWGAK